MHSKYEIRILKHIYRHGRTHFDNLPVKDKEIKQSALDQLVEEQILYACHSCRIGAAGNKFHAADGSYDISNKNAVKGILDDYHKEGLRFWLPILISIVALLASFKEELAALWQLLMQ